MSGRSGSDRRYLISSACLFILIRPDVSPAKSFMSQMAKRRSLCPPHWPLFICSLRQISFNSVQTLSLYWLCKGKLQHGAAHGCVPSVTRCGRKWKRNNAVTHDLWNLACSPNVRVEVIELQRKNAAPKALKRASGFIGVYSECDTWPVRCIASSRLCLQGGS